MDGLLFGLTDNGVLLLCMYTGISIDNYIEGRTNGLLGAVLGAGIVNTFSDCMAACIDPSMRAAVVGITIGCLIPLLLIPIIERFRN